MSNVQTFFLQREQKATIVANAFASGYYATSNSGSQPTDFVTIAAGQTYTIGPSNSDANYIISLDRGAVSLSITFAGTEKGVVDDLVEDVADLTEDVSDLETMINSQASVTQAANADVSGATTLNVANGCAFQITPTDTTTLAFTFPADEVRSMLLIIVNGGAETVNWPGTMLWAGGTEPTLTASGVDLVTVIHDGNNNLYGAVVGLDMQVA